MPISNHTVNVLVTRPAQQASNLCHKLEAANFNAIRYPSIEIQAINNPALAKEQLAHINQKDFLIFTSVNAVLQADLLLHKHWPTLNSTLVAIGPKTAEALSNIDLNPSIIAPKPFNSESLINQFNPTLNNKTCVIIKGEGGRPFLAENLRQRGMSLTSIDVYRRSIPTQTLPLKQRLDYITITSQLALSNLFSLLQDRAPQVKQNCHFIVFSQRIADYAISLNCRHVYTCAEASDSGLVFTIIEIEKAREF